MNATDYAQRADQHRPQDETALALEVARLRSEGLSGRDIASALRIELAEVFRLLTLASLHRSHQRAREARR